MLGKGKAGNKLAFFALINLQNDKLIVIVVSQLIEENPMKYYLIYIMIAAFGVIAVSTMDLQINDSVVDRINRIKSESMDAQAASIAKNVGVERLELREVLDRLDNFGARAKTEAKGQKASHQERVDSVVLQELGRMLKEQTKRCPQANNYIAANVESKLRSNQVVNINEANAWLKQAEQMCFSV